MVVFNTRPGIRIAITLCDMLAHHAACMQSDWQQKEPNAENSASPSLQLRLLFRLNKTLQVSRGLHSMRQYNTIHSMHILVAFWSLIRARRAAWKKKKINRHVQLLLLLCKSNVAKEIVLKTRRAIRFWFRASRRWINSSWLRGELLGLNPTTGRLYQDIEMYTLL